MAQEHMCQQAREIFTNQIQSKTQQPNKILDHRDLWIDWRFDYDGIIPGKKLYILVHWDSRGLCVVHGENLLRVQFLSVSPFHKSIIELVTESERECRMEAYLLQLVTDSERDCRVEAFLLFLVTKSEKECRVEVYLLFQCAWW